MNILQTIKVYRKLLSDDNYGRYCVSSNANGFVYLGHTGKNFFVKKFKKYGNNTRLMETKKVSAPSALLLILKS